MRLFAAVLAVVVGSACSSSSSEPACELVGTYKLAGTNRKGDCPSTGGDTLVTVSERGSALVAEFQGVQGGCPLTKTGTCGWQTKCDLDIVDATGPQKQGTLQLSVSVDGASVSGTSALYLPPAKDLPKGCSATADLIGSRM